jgi:hypothetical protein
MRERRKRDEPARESLKERNRSVRERVAGVVVDDEAIAEPVANNARSGCDAGSDAVAVTALNARFVGVLERLGCCLEPRGYLRVRVDDYFRLPSSVASLSLSNPIAAGFFLRSGHYLSTDRLECVLACSPVVGTANALGHVKILVCRTSMRFRTFHPFRLRFLASVFVYWLRRIVHFGSSTFYQRALARYTLG